DLMVINTTCTCKACRNLPNLDLKFFIHYGIYSVQHLGDFKELVGNDVNLVHRIAKNTITETTGLKAYAAYTQAVIDELEMQDIKGSMSGHTETFSDVGEVQLYIQDLHHVWKARKDQLRVTVDPENTAAVFMGDFPIPPPLFWDYITQPEYRAILMDSDTQVLTEKTAGRIDRGTVYTCAHGNLEIVQKIVDWEPFEQYTINEKGVLGNWRHNITFRIEPDDEGSQLVLLIGRHTDAGILNKFLDMLSSIVIGNAYKKGLIQIKSKISQDMAVGVAVITPQIKFGNQLASKAIAESLTETVS
ncbi:MAG: DUF2652 domain-containing protein, partial [Chloroflexota bacterium]